MVDTGGVDEADVVLGEADWRQRLEAHAEILGFLADRRMHGAHEAVEEARLDAAGVEELAHVFEGVHGVLHGLRGEAVHQVGVHQDAGVREALGDAGHLVHRDALLHQLEQAVGGHLEAARDGDAAAVGELSAELGGEGLLEADVAPPRDRAAAAGELVGQGLEHLGRRGFVDKMEAGLAGLGHHRLDAVDQQLGAGGVVAADVVEAHVAEAALLPVAAMGHGELVPAPVGPQPVHRVEHVEYRQVAVEGQAVPGGRADLGEGDVGLGEVEIAHLALLAQIGAHQARLATLAGQVFEQRQQRALAVVQRDEVEMVEHAGLGELAEFGVHEAAAEHRDDGRVVGLDGLGDAEGRIHRARKRHRQQHHLGRVAGEGVEGEALQRLVHQRGRRGQRPGQGLEAGLGHRQRFCVAHELEALVGGFAQHVSEVVEVERGQVAGLVLHPQRAEGPGQRVAAVGVVVHVERGEARPLGQ